MTDFDTKLKEAEQLRRKQERAFLKQERALAEARKNIAAIKRERAYTLMDPDVKDLKQRIKDHLNAVNRLRRKLKEICKHLRPSGVKAYTQYSPCTICGKSGYVLYHQARKEKAKQMKAAAKKLVHGT